MSHKTVSLFCEDSGHEHFVSALTQNKELTVCAIPDPHVERWMLISSRAFKCVFGEGCDAPTYKCEKDRYKKLLIDAIRQTGTTPIFGGMEYAEAIVDAMDIEEIVKKKETLATFIQELKAMFKA